MHSSICHAAPRRPGENRSHQQLPTCKDRPAIDSAPTANLGFTATTKISLKSEETGNGWIPRKREKLSTIDCIEQKVETRFPQTMLPSLKQLKMCKKTAFRTSRSTRVPAEQGREWSPVASYEYGSGQRRSQRQRDGTACCYLSTLCNLSLTS